MIKETIITISLTVFFTMAIGTCFVKTVFEMLEMLWNDNDKKHDQSLNRQKPGST